MNIIEEVRVKLVKGMPYFREKPITCAEDVFPIIIEEFGDMDRECIVVLNMDAKLRPINYHVANIGATQFSVTDIGSIFRAALLSDATRIMVLHNHLSGDTTPSKDDIQLTEKLKKAGEILDINVVDHMVFNMNGDVYSICFDKKVGNFLSH